jgi:2'-5' RNA ligase
MDRSENTLRLFIGIKIAACKGIIDVSNRLRRELRDSKLAWVNPANFHITIKFLGDLEAYYINPISLILEKLSNEYNSFELEYDKTGFFGSVAEPRVIWYGFRNNSTLLSLQHNIERSLNELGLEAENKKFNPHITLCRVKFLSEKQSFREILSEKSGNAEKTIVTQFQLIESVLSNTVAEYMELGSFKLK